MTVVKMKTLIIFIYLCFGILNVCASEINKPTKITTTKQIADDTTKTITTTNTAAEEAAVAAASEPVATIALTNDATKDKRETKDTKDASNGYANHRSDTATATVVHRNSNTNSDDPEDPQETVYGTNARQFLIRPQQPQQQQLQSEEEQLPPQLRNYPATIRPHSTQLLEQSQEIQHFAYLQDLNRNQHKPQNQGKSQSPQSKKSSSASLRSHAPTSQVEETEQRYAVAVEQPIPLHPRGQQYRQQIPYQLALQQQQHQQHQAEQQNGQQAQYQIIPEEQFLKILEEELQARAYHEDQLRRQQTIQASPQRQHQQQQQQHQQQHQQSAAAAAAAASQKVALQAQGLGNYRQRLEAEEDGQPEYVQYVQRPRGGPKYLPLPQGGAQEQQAEQELVATPQPLPQLPPQIAYYRPQISYKALPNHPLAKSSLEKEIEMLLASNKPNVSPVQIVDNSNEPSALVNHHRAPSAQPPQPQPSVRTPKAYVPSTVAPNSLTDANDQPFVPSLFRYSNYPSPPQPTQNYPAPVSQQIIDAKKLGPVVYPPQNPPPTPSAPTPVQASQFYYQEAAPSPSPSPRPKAYRSKYGTKFATTPTPLKARQNEINYQAHNKYAQPLYDLQRPVPSAAPGSPTHFYPSPPDPHRNIPPPTAQPTPSVTTKYAAPPSDFRQYALPGPSPSQSSIYVSQGTGIATPSRPISTAKPKTVDDLKQLHLPQPGGKPLTQAEFQALVDAGYPVTAVPVPVPVPYEQYVKDHPDYRNQPPPQPPALPVNYEHLMRFAQLQQHHQVPQQYGPQRPPHPRALVGRPSEPSVKIISSASEPQTATAIGGGSVTYLRAIPENQKRRPRDENETKVLGAKEDAEGGEVAIEEMTETKQIAEKTK